MHICALATAALTLTASTLPASADVDFAGFSRARDAELSSRVSQRARALTPRARNSADRSGRGQGNVAVAMASPGRHDRLAPPTSPLPQTPLLLVVSLDKQQMSVYSEGKLLEQSKVSTGTSSDPTPSGVFAVIEKAERHFSNIYRGAPMPFMQRLTMSGVALHSGHVTGRPASHGCVRLPHEYARRLFKATKLGVRVIVSTHDPVPTDIADMRLLEPARLAAATKVADASAIVTGSVNDSAPTPTPAAATDNGTPRIVPISSDKSIDPRTGKAKGQYSLARDEVLRAAPVSILVSRADSRVYVRHMFEPVIEAPITFAEPSRPLGTHVYTLASVGAEGVDQRWSAMTVGLAQRRAAAAARVLIGNRSRTARNSDPAASMTSADQGTASTAAEAVARFNLPPEIVAQIAPLLRPGASLVVTDLPQSRRTQTGWTDITVTP